MRTVMPCLLPMPTPERWSRNLRPTRKPNPCMKRQSPARLVMRDECLEEASSMLGRQLSAGQVTKIEERGRNQMRVLARENPEEWRARTYTDRLHEAAAAAAQEMKDEFAKKRQDIEKT